MQTKPTSPTSPISRIAKGAMAERYISILLTMHQAQAGALAKFATHIALSEIGRTAKDHEELDLIKGDIDQWVKAFYAAGCRLPEPIWGQPGTHLNSSAQHGLYGSIPKFGPTGISNFHATFT
jgi:hypothetical protein